MTAQMMPYPLYAKMQQFRAIVHGKFLGGKAVAKIEVEEVELFVEIITELSDEYENIKALSER